MRLTSRARYAVMAMVDLAIQEANRTQEDPIALSAIALRQDLPLQYLEQLFHKLKKSGLVTSSRGSAGGYRLTRPPKNITIHDIIAAVDRPLQATRCTAMGQEGCQGTRLRCLTHDLWDELTGVVSGFFRHITLADVCSPCLKEKARAFWHSPLAPDPSFKEVVP